MTFDESQTVIDRRTQCLQVIKAFENLTKETFHVLTHSKKSCQIDGSNNMLIAELDMEALKHVSL